MMLFKSKFKRAKQALLEMVNIREPDPARVVEMIMAILAKHKLELPSDVQDIRHADENTIPTEMSSNFVILKSNGTNPDLPTLVGKGITFDSGGYNIKNDMTGMFFDKNGACLALVLAALYGNPFSVMFANNLVKENSRFLPGMILDIGKKKVLIADTDAEGRLLLAHLLATGVPGNSQHIIATGTLTGYACYAMGDMGAAIVLSEKEGLDKILVEDFHHKTNRLWPMPHNKDQEKETVSTTVVGADYTNLKNSIPGSAAVFYFLKQFRPKDKLLTFVDIAPMMMDKAGNAVNWGLEEFTKLMEHLKD